MAILFRKADKANTSAVGTAVTRLGVLTEALKAADDAYYNSSKPVLSDSRYDSYREEARKLLKELKPKTLDKYGSRVISKAESYFKGVGSPVRASKRSEKLPTELGSLKKVKSDDDKALKRFIANAQKASMELGSSLAKKSTKYASASKVLRRGSIAVTTSPKLDGLTLLLHYRRGKLLNAYTRGDGVKGQNKTDHALALARLDRLPATLPKPAFHKFASEDIYVKGEVVCRLKAFKAKWQDKGFTNARNAASGWLNRDNPSHPIHNAIDFIAYDVFTPEGELGIELGYPEIPEGAGANKLNTLTCLKRAGFKTYLKSGFFSHTTITGEPPAEWIARLKAMLTELSYCPYQLDGIVIEVSDNFIRKEMGSKDGRPRFAIAYKTSADDIDNNESATSTITKVEYNTSKVGALKPTLHYKPVKVMDSTLSKATGNNVSYLLTTGLGVGANVRVVKAGGIIPRVYLVGAKAKRESIVPVKCECGAPAVEVKIRGKVLPDWYCSKPKTCKVIQRERLSTAIKHLKLTGLAGKTIDKLFDAGFHSISDLLSASPKSIGKIPGFGQAMIASITIGLPKAIKDASVADLMEMSGVFVAPGLSLSRESFSKLEKILGKDLNSKDIHKAVTAIGPAKGKLFIDKYPEWVAYKKAHLAGYI